MSSLASTDDRDDSKLRLIAKQIYCTMTVVRFEDISKRVGVSVAQLKRWQLEERWLGLRAEKFESRKKSIDSRRKAALEQKLAVCNSLLARVKEQAQDGPHYPNALRCCVETLAKLHALESSLFEELSRIAED